MTDTAVPERFRSAAVMIAGIRIHCRLSGDAPARSSPRSSSSFAQIERKAEHPSAASRQMSERGFWERRDQEVDKGFHLATDKAPRGMQDPDLDVMADVNAPADEATGRQRIGDHEPRQ